MRVRPLLMGALALVLFACPAAAAPWRWGVRAGINGANFSGDFGQVAQSSLRYGLNAGFVSEVELAHPLSLHGEIAYSNKGAKVDERGTDVNGNPVVASQDTWSLNYIEVPVLVRARLKRGRGTTLFAELGPSFGFALGGRFVWGSPGIPETDLKDVMKSVDVGFALGTGMEFASGPGRLGIDARYTRGFSDLYDLPDNLSTINQVWTLALSWMR